MFKNQNEILQGKISKYQIIGPLGGGNFGTVYKIKDLSTEEIKAVKQIKKKSMQVEKKLKELIRSEIKIMSELIKLKTKNPNIVRYYEDFEDNDSIYIVMEFCKHGDLRKYLKGKPNKILPESEVLNIFKDLLNGFKALHQIKAIHRDFKPDNIFISDKIFKIGDFGFGKQVSLAETVLGTPAYMALEVLTAADNHDQYDNKCDMWSLAVCTYEMLFGFCPFNGADFDDIINQMKYNKINFNPGKNKISESCIDLLKRMLVLDPQKRIEWTELYVHPWVYDNKLGNIIDKRDLTITLNRSFYENLIKEKKFEEVKEQPEFNFDPHKNRYLHYRNVISHLIYVLEKGWFKFQDISYNFGLFVFAKNIFFLYQQLFELLKNKTNKYKLGNFENFILTDDYKEIFKVVNLGFEDYDKYYSLYSMQLDDLHVNASNELFNRLKQFCSPNNLKFERNEYDYLIYRYLSKWDKIINNDFDNFKFFWMFLDCIEWKEIFYFDEKNQTGFNFSDYRNKIEEIDKNQFDITIMNKRIESINKKMNDN